MTIQQLQYVLEISKTGSISKAARNLYISQPNISNAIKNLEQELGIAIFERTPMGMQLTVSGHKLVQKAISIMADIQEITAECQGEEIKSFRLVYPRYIPAFDAFAELCSIYQDSLINFSCYIGNEIKQVENIYRNRCDLVVYLNTMKDLQFNQMCKDFRVKFVPVKKLNYYIQLSENHPLLQEETFCLEKLKDYPCVAFADLSGWNTNWIPAKSFINTNRLIRVQSTSSRINMLAKTNAYSIVLSHSEEYNQLHHVVQIPYDGDTITLGYLYSVDRGLTDLAKEYIELLEKQLSF